MPDYYTGNYILSPEEMHVNALYFARLLTDAGWTFNAIAGMLGNAQSESRINPGAWQDYTEQNWDADDKGYGLVQWTPARDFLAWCTERGLNKELPDTALKRFDWEAENGKQYFSTTAYPQPSTFYNFMRSTLDPNYLARAWLYNYERPLTPDPATRGKQGDYWYSYITGNPLPRKRSKIIYYLRRKQIF